MGARDRTCAAFSPTDEDARLARASVEALADLLKNGRADDTLHLRVRSAVRVAADIELPRAAAQVMLAALRAMAEGLDVTLLSADSELTTQQAADMMYVSRPFLVKLLESGQVPFRKVGSHRRIRVQDIERYLAIERTRRERVMEDLVAETERLGLYE